MIKKLLFNLAFLLFLTTVNAGKIDGIILKGSDTIKVKFNIPMGLISGEPIYEKIQHKITYFDASGKRKTLKADDATEIRFDINGNTVRMLSRLNSLGLGNIFSSGTNIFLKLEIDGPLKMFKYHFTSSQGGAVYLDSDFILQKGNDVLMQPSIFSFKREMTEYFSNCPKLVEKIESKDFRKKHLEEIVNYYNSECSK